MKHTAKNAAQRALELAWDGKLPVSPKGIAEKLQIKRTLPNGKEIHYTVKVIGKTTKELEGYSGQARLEPDEYTPTFVCEYNAFENRYRSRFTIAHELGHVLLGHVKEGRNPKRDSSFKENSYDQDEVAANNFAAELLMPEKEVRHLYSQKPPIAKLAQAFGVSEIAMLYRLKNLNLV